MILGRFHLTLSSWYQQWYWCGKCLTLSSKSQTKTTRDWFDFTEEQPPRADILRRDNTSEHSVAHDDIGDSQKDGSTHISNKCLKETTSAAKQVGHNSTTGDCVKDRKKETKTSRATSVTNLSQHNLTGPQISLLEKGLKFISGKHQVNRIKLLADLSEWERRMRLAEYFYDDGQDNNVQQEERDKFKLKKKSTFTPESGRDKSLDLYIELVKEDVVANMKRSSKLNISEEENAAFYELLHNKDIVIRPADKGSGIVVVDKIDYITQLQKEIEGSKSYEKTESDKTEDIHKKVKKLVNKLYRDGVISDDLKQYLTPRYAGKGKLKGNPKLHKPNAPYRTIVSGIGTPTEKLAEFAEHELTERHHPISVIQQISYQN